MENKIIANEKIVNDFDKPVFYHSLNELDHDGVKAKPKFNVTKLNSSDLVEKNESNLPEYSKLPLPSNDAVPDRDNYRNLMSLTGEAKSRPTLLELQNYQRLSTTDTDSVQKGLDIADSTDFKTKENSTNQKSLDVIKFGWIKGVLVRCVLNIFGVMIFLRVSWLVGQAGVGLMSVIILLATLVTVITTLSTSAICTNGEIRGGGAYYLISRSLGPEFGGAIGIVFSFANAVGCAMYTIGFAETLVALLRDYDLKIDSDPVNDVRLIGLITIIILFILALVGMSWEAKVQIFLLGILLVAFVDFIVGTILSPTDEQKSKGFVGYSVGQLKENFLPDYRDGEDFAHLFGVFFPAVTGILAGANISGNLKNPQKAIPKGTLLSIVITSFVYLLFSWMCGASISREATGNVQHLANNTFLNCNQENVTCKDGLLHNYQIMQMVSLWAPIITAGIFSASLSSALASLVSAPKVFQAVCEDKIFPKIEYFAVGRGKDNEPFRGYVLTFVIACVFILIGDLNAIAPIISNFFLMSYALINYSCFDASLAKASGWRPAFKYYNKWVSLFGALLCITVMFLIKWWAALISFIIIAGLHLYVKQSKPNINWGSSTQAHIFRRSLEYSLKLMSIEEHVKNFRPNFLVLTGAPTTRPALCDIVAAITKNRSLMICANIITDSVDKYNIDYVSWMHKRKYKSFYSELRSPSMRTGAFSMMQTVGIGKLRPNTLMIGFKNDWQVDKIESVIDYYELINDAFLLKFGICILRLDGGLDYSDLLDNFSTEKDSSSSESESEGESALSNSEDTNLKKQNIEFLISKQNKSNLNQVFNKNPSYSYLSKFNEKTFELEKTEPFVESLTPNKNSFLKSTEVIKLKNTKINKGILQGINIFHHKYQRGFVDVWWTYDDGGLSVLIPYLLLQKKHWQKCKLRIFIQTKNNSDNVSEEQRNLATLLSKFRIDFNDLIVFSTTNKKPQQSTVSIYEKMIENWRLKPNETLEQYPWKISEEIYKQNLDKINQQLILKDLLIEHSQNSSFIFITISVPNRLQTCAGLYLSKLDLISYEMPPMMMIRGNQNSVLTYYS
ncbi:solute carrier family 12 member 2 [Brachionus plicatilis]|uniref:Solute carrier family 12 member 2 n=1 Tax=Brachionus plicatilis TaxID=10195 RepID=A0A3M7PM11_BRAPC|nr:solute carrier family 12 member 2 [Brachionus plicatilis]